MCETLDQGDKEEKGGRTRTAGYSTADNTCHRYARIEKLGLLLRLDFYAGKLAHLAHFPTNLLYASMPLGETSEKGGVVGEGVKQAMHVNTSVSKCAS
jgi:hypothetical protein